MNDPNGAMEAWSDAVSEASKHVEERAEAGEAASERIRPKKKVAWIVVAVAALTAVSAWDVWVLTRPPDPPSARDQEADLRWLVADVVDAVEDFRSTAGRLPSRRDLLDVLGEDMVYEVRDAGYVVLAQGDSVQLEFDGTVPLAEWVALGGSPGDPETTR